MGGSCLTPRHLCSAVPCRGQEHRLATHVHLCSPASWLMLSAPTLSSSEGFLALVEVNRVDGHMVPRFSSCRHCQKGNGCFHNSRSLHSIAGGLAQGGAQHPCQTCPPLLSACSISHLIHWCSPQTFQLYRSQAKGSDRACLSKPENCYTDPLLGLISLKALFGQHL